MLAVMTPFMFVGIWLDTVLPLGILSKIYGAIVVVVGVRGLVLKQQRFMPKWLLAVLLVLAGLIQGMFVSGGRHSRDLRAPSAFKIKTSSAQRFRAFGWCSISCMPRCSLAKGTTRPIVWSWSPSPFRFCLWLRGLATSCEAYQPGNVHQGDLCVAHGDWYHPSCEVSAVDAGGCNLAVCIFGPKLARRCASLPSDCFGRLDGPTRSCGQEGAHCRANM